MYQGIPTPEYAARLRANKKAWAFFQSQPPGYRRTVTFLVVSAKKEETREKRLAHVIEQSAQGKRIQQLVSPAKRKLARRAGRRAGPHRFACPQPAHDVHCRVTLR